jgi:hypothetical protein
LQPLSEVLCTAHQVALVLGVGLSSCCEDLQSWLWFVRLRCGDSVRGSGPGGGGRMVPFPASPPAIVISLPRKMRSRRERGPLSVALSVTTDPISGLDGVEFRLAQPYVIASNRASLGGCESQDLTCRTVLDQVVFGTRSRVQNPPFWHGCSPLGHGGRSSPIAAWRGAAGAGLEGPSEP